MITVKVQCDCGQRYAFDVEPVNGRMPSPVACPVCGTDGTAAANALIAQTLGAQPVTAPRTTPPISIAPPPGQSVAPQPPTPGGGLRLNISATSHPGPSTPPPIPTHASQPTGRTLPQRPIQKKQTHGKDGWATPETGFNKLGTYITVTPAILAAMISWGAFGGLEVSPMILGIVVGACGVAGGTINVMGRGPIVAGAFVGLFMALGGYGAVYWWIHSRESVYKIEAIIAFALGAAPGFILQYLIQLILRKRSRSG